MTMTKSAKGWIALGVLIFFAMVDLGVLSFGTYKAFADTMACGPEGCSLNQQAQ